MSDKRDFDPRFDPAFQRGYVDGGASAPRQQSASADPEPVVTLAGNPWITVLWVIAGVFVLGGVAGQACAQTSFRGNVSTSGPDVFMAYIIPSVLQSICPWMVLTGLAALVGVVFLHAVRWRSAE